jgi:hypothetical protein
MRSVVIGCALALFFLGASGSAATSGCTSDWRVSASPKLPGSNHLNGVAAVSRRDVWAVGVRAAVENNAGGRTLAEHWDG